MRKDAMLGHPAAAHRAGRRQGGPEGPDRPRQRPVRGQSPPRSLPRRASCPGVARRAPWSWAGLTRSAARPMTGRSTAHGDKFIEVDTTYGVHVTWIFSASTVSPYADRNMRYNYYDFTGRQWANIDPTNFMNSGVNVFTIRSGFGMLDVDPVTGCAYVCCHQVPSNIDPTVAKDAAPGAGIFTECAGTPSADGYQWPSMGLTSSEQVHVALCDNATTHGIFESDVNPWCTWSAPVQFQDTAPIPGFPTYIVTGSKTSTKAVMSWEYENASGPGAGYYRQTTDDGATWDPAVPIPFPPAYTPGSESLPSFTISGIYPFLDNDDNLHIVATVGWAIRRPGYRLLRHSGRNLALVPADRNVEQGCALGRGYGLLRQHRLWRRVQRAVLRPAHAVPERTQRVRVLLGRF